MNFLLYLSFLNAEEPSLLHIDLGDGIEHVEEPVSRDGGQVNLQQVHPLQPGHIHRQMVTLAFAGCTP
jgi:hypothetical protein